MTNYKRSIINTLEILGLFAFALFGFPALLIFGGKWVDWLWEVLG